MEDILGNAFQNVYPYSNIYLYRYQTYKIDLNNMYNVYLIHTFNFTYAYVIYFVALINRSIPVRPSPL